MLSPLRYPGGKSDFAGTAHRIVQSLALSNATLVEPFAGSAIVSLALLDSGAVARAVLIEKDPLIYAFWKSLFTKTDELIERFLELPITLETWHRLRPLLKVHDVSSDELVSLGLAALFFNRANFSGILAAGPIGGMGQNSKYSIDCRTNKDEVLVRLLAAASLADSVEVLHIDAVDYISNCSDPNAIFYVDPPYFQKGELLYRHYYRMGDHRKLADALAIQERPWFLSYDVHHVIEYLYERFTVNRLSFRYSAHSPKNHDELLISNFHIPASLLDSAIVRTARQAHSASNSNKQLVGAITRDR